MEYSNTSPIGPVPNEASRALPEVSIPAANAITLSEALTIAHRSAVPLGKSTLQRWAKIWAETPGGEVKSVLQVTRDGRHYELDRDDYESWLIEQANNQKTPPDLGRPPEAPEDLARSHGAPQGPAGPHQTWQDPGRSHEASRATNDEEVLELEQRVKTLEDENLQLKIDVGVRRELVAAAKSEIDKMRGSVEHVLRENGALEFQLRQLQSPQQNPQIMHLSQDHIEVDSDTGDDRSMV